MIPQIHMSIFGGKQVWYLSDTLGSYMRDSYLRQASSFLNIYIELFHPVYICRVLLEVLCKYIQGEIISADTGVGQQLVTNPG